MSIELKLALAHLREALHRSNIPDDILASLINCIQEAEYNPIREARRTLAAAFKQDRGFRDTYVANIACVIMDFEKALHEPDSNHAPMTHANRQELADKILRHILET